MTLRRWILIFLAAFVLFLAESSLLPWLFPASWRSGVLVYPKLVLVSIIYIGMLHHRHTGAAFGFCFGMLQDVVFYGHMLGLNAFLYALAAYIAGLFIRTNAVNLFSVFILQMGGLLLYELASYALYRLFGVTDADFRWTFLHGALPSLLFSLFFALALYIPARSWLEPPAKSPDQEEE